MRPRMFGAAPPRGVEWWGIPVYLRSIEAVALVAAVLTVEMVEGRFDLAADEALDQADEIATAVLCAELLQRHPTLPRDSDGRLDRERAWWVTSMVDTVASMVVVDALRAMLALRPPEEDDDRTGAI